MKNQILNKMALEYRMLWEASKKTRISDSHILERLQRKVSEARQSVRSQGRDTLVRKLNNYGNSGEWGVKMIQELGRVIYQDKSPERIDLGEWISIEIECLFREKVKETEFVAFVRQNKWANFVTLKHDGSIYPAECDCGHESEEGLHTYDCNGDGSAYGKEIVVTFKYGQWDMIRAICKKLNSLGCFVNKTCGLHVHFDMRHLNNAREASTIGHRIARAVPALKLMLPKSRQNNRFCAENINSIGERDSGDNRYAFVNMLAYQRHKTLEIRGHSGTTDAEKIVNWIRIIRKVMATPIRSEVTTKEAFLEKFNLEPDLEAHYLNRVAKFANAYPVPRDHDDVAQDNYEAETGTAERSYVAQVTDQADVESNRHLFLGVDQDGNRVYRVIASNLAIILNESDAITLNDQGNVA